MNWQFLTKFRRENSNISNFLPLKIVNFGTEIKLTIFRSFSRICSFWTKNGPLTHCDLGIWTYKLDNFYRFGVLSPPHKISSYNYLKITIPQPVFVWLAFCQIRVNLPKLFNVQKVPGWIQNTNVKFGDDIDAYPPNQDSPKYSNYNFQCDWC